MKLLIALWLSLFVHPPHPGAPQVMMFYTSYDDALVLVTSQDLGQNVLVEYRGWLYRRECAASYFLYTRKPALTLAARGGCET